MPSLVVLYEPEDRASAAIARTLQSATPPEFQVTAIVSNASRDLAETIGEHAPDLLWIPRPDSLPPARDLLRRRKWPTKLIASWNEEPPRRLAEFFDVHASADAWVFGDARYWEIVGRLPSSFVARHTDDSDDGTNCFAWLQQLSTAPPSTELCDLSDKVTVFVSTVGDPGLELCLQRLRDQDCRFQLEIVDHVAPMHRAFQSMLDRCRTPFYVQVDEDMLLHPHAVRTLYEALSTAPPTIAVYVADLYDPHLDRCIFGLKIFRHEVVRRYPFSEAESFEVDQLLRMEKDGFAYRKTEAGMHPVPGKTLGIHAVRWTPAAIYLRYKNLTRRSLDFPERMRWFNAYPAEFLRRFEKEPSAENFFALQGVLAGLLQGADEPITSKDYREYDRLSGFEALQRCFEELRRSPT